MRCTHENSHQVMALRVVRWMTLLLHMGRHQVRQHVGKQMLLVMVGTYTDMVGTVGCLLGRETASDTVTSDARPTDTHQVVVIRASWVEAVMTEVELLVSRVLQVVLTRYARRTVAKADSVRSVVAVKGMLLLLGKWVTSMNTMLWSQ